jgi:hypothetical protein
MIAAAAIAVAAIVPARAAAQTPTDDASTAQALEQLVSRELSAIGEAPSRHELRLQLQQVATRWLVSLIDAGDGSVVASTRTEALPADRDAAVAMLTQIVTDLEVAAIEARQRPKPAEPAPLPPAPRTAPRPTGRVFQINTLRFAGQYEVDAVNGKVIVNRAWVVFHGDPGRALEPVEFYRLVGRDDLAVAYRHRRIVKIVGYVIGSAGMVTGLALGALNERDCSMCTDGLVVPALLAAGGGVAGLTLGIYLERNPHPIDEAEARTLADQYNQQLRSRYGLPPVAATAPGRDAALIPYVTGRVGGLALRVRF